MKEFMTREEVAEYFDISLRTLSSWVDRGLPYIVVGRRVFFQRKDIIEFMEMHKTLRLG